MTTIMSPTLISFLVKQKTLLMMIPNKLNSNKLKQKKLKQKRFQLLKQNILFNQLW
eukprot:CAMPEP_0114399958 /NCGR_PEP_ID=MMETSP0102-20121206/16024_1 /TAXON_ID=38822 ORGANISM="Pteridomonas danica, Strain PT" /NCGR_SAMPLE_ID=MMETSP0102 /ASSEMBLY_ACC=CAM_ASM_000212 /LENGTH=55 /DNA_ID=CAMNT_0001562069 /DNA_START=62 /DNA_END=229 /DNA_ORIENTATION=+